VRLLLDTNILLGLIDGRFIALQRPMRDVIISSDNVSHVSVASLWEIAIKVRLGRLKLAVSPTSLPELIERMALQLIAINHHHVLAGVQPEPATRDPFDRLLLAQCLIENLQLLTTDRVLVKHPLAWRSA
jgi:PIN domain nuclease of toxin-antitoxin system